MKRYFGRKPDGGPSWGLWWCWDDDTRVGCWVNADGSWAEPSGFTLDQRLNAHRIMEVFTLPGMIDEDLRTDGGL